MSGFLARLAEKAAGATPALTPVVTPLYGTATLPGARASHATQAPALRGDPIDRDGFVEESGEQAATAPRVARSSGDDVSKRAPDRSSSPDRHEAYAVHLDGVRRAPPAEDGLKAQPAPPRQKAPGPEAFDEPSAAGHELRPRSPNVDDGARRTPEGDWSRREPGRRVQVLPIEHAQPSDGERRPGPAFPNDERRIPSTRADASRRDPVDPSAALAGALARLREFGGALPSASGPADQAPPPVVRISIGRIEVRAAPPVAPPASRSIAPATVTGPSLSEYLSKRPRSRE